MSVDDLWRRIGEGLDDGARGYALLRRGEHWLGHPSCNRFVPGIVASRADEVPRFHPVRLEGDAVDTRVVDGFLQRFGGVSFRLDSPSEVGARLLALGVRVPGFVLRNAFSYARHWLRRLDPKRPARAAADLVRGRLRLDIVVIVSHHFMSRAELESPVGAERLAHCVFHVPIGDRLVSMCEVNALGARERYYAEVGAGD